MLRAVRSCARFQYLPPRPPRASDARFFCSIAVSFPPSGSWSGVDIVWNIVFIVDLVINLNTGFIDETGVVSELFTVRRLQHQPLSQLEEREQ